MVDYLAMICRMCLQCSDLVDIFSEGLTKLDFHEKIQKYLKQDIKQEDDLPKFICLNCMKKVMDFHSYCLQVAENQQFLRNNFKIHVDVPIIKEVSDAEKFGGRLRKLEQGPPETLLCKNTENESSQDEYINLFEESNDNVSVIEIETTKTIDIAGREIDVPKQIVKDGRYIIRRRSLMELVSRFYTLKCDLCAKNKNGNLYSNISRLLSHFKKVHSTNGYVICCGLKLNTRDVMALHMVRHVQPEAFRCSICGKKASNFKLLQGHMKCHSSENSSSEEIRCEECGKKCNSLHFLEIHKIKVHTESSTSQSDVGVIEPHKDFPELPSTIMKNGALIFRGKELAELLAKFYEFSCDLCLEKQIYPVLSSLHAHYKDVHSIKGYIRCCDIQLKSRNRMINHMARHLDPEAFTCPQCGKITTNRSLLRQHLETHKPKDEKLYFCPECPKRYSSSSGLAKHLISHIPIENRRKFICYECGKVYFNLGALQDHVRCYHSVQKFICDQCGKQFKHKAALAQHTVSHNKTGKKERVKKVPNKKLPICGSRRPNLPFEKDCSICGGTFETKQAMKNHMSEKHDTVHKCPLCNYTNKRWELLSRHIAERHIEKKLSCNVCGQYFRYLHLLRDHAQVHTGTRRYTCEFCGKKYASASGFCRHRREVHAVEYEQLKKKRREILRSKKVLSEGMDEV